MGLVTSATGAALYDMLTVLGAGRQTCPSLSTRPRCRAAPPPPRSSRPLPFANRRAEVDVLIVGRGGGSLEDLWCFNEEAVARAIVHSTIPVVSAVGHEVDVTISDFAADLRAPTLRRRRAGGPGQQRPRPAPGAPAPAAHSRP